MKYIIDHGGVALESEYPYLAADGPKCDHRAAHHKVRLRCAVIHVDHYVQDMLWHAVSKLAIQWFLPLFLTTHQMSRLVCCKWWQYLSVQ